MFRDVIARTVARAQAWHRRRAAADERGMALVWAGGCLFMLLLAAGFAIDLVHAYQVGQRAQNAADASALAGTVFLPANPTNAKARAVVSAADNGFSTIGATTVTPRTSTDDSELQPTQIEVEIKTEVPTLFARVVGFNSVHVRRTAVADYDNPVAMGSPSNTMGNQPDCVTPCSSGDDHPQYWLNVAGPKSSKAKGDRHQANVCSGADNCSGTNQDYVTDGYLFVVRNQSAGATIEIEAFDPAFVNVGDKCPADDRGSQLSNLYTATSNPRFNYVTTPSNPADPGWAYCTGDQWFNGASEDPVEGPYTLYRFYEPDATPGDVSDNTLIGSCTRGFDPVQGSLLARYNAEIAPGSLVHPTVTQYFRQWVPMCSVSNADVGDYVVQVQTNRNLDGSDRTNGGGHNRFALRVKSGGSLSATSVRMFGLGKLPIYANATGSDTRFHLAQILPGAANRKLRITFFDVGDASDVGTLTVLPPADSNYATFNGCTYTAPPGNSSGPPFGTFAATGGGCSVSGVSSSTWNGQIIEWLVPIPSDYNCDYLDPTGCWVKMKFQYGSSVQVSDTTTWSATLDGNPVRIIN